MRIVTFAAVAAGMLVGGSACAAPQSAPLSFNPPNAEPCFRSEQAIRFHGETDQALILRTSIGRYYRIGFAAACPNIMRKDMNVTLIPRSPGEICRPFDLRIISTASQLPMECAVSSIEPLTAEQVRALPAKVRP